MSADFLKEDAAVAYLAAGNLEGALLEYKACNQWSMTLSLAGLSSPSPLPDFFEAYLGSPGLLWHTRQEMSKAASSAVCVLCGTAIFQSLQL